MYEAFYGFTEKPFNLTPDPKYLYLSARHTEAFAHLEFGRRERGGFAVITGEVGTGKTTLARYFLARLGERTSSAVVLYPALTAAELLRSILDDLHVTAAGGSLKELVDALHRFLLLARAESREVVLLIDEAQDLAPEVLEQIRLLSNLETDTEKLIQIVLMGQSELLEMLGRRELRQLAQRVTARYHLDPLSREETEEYVRHRLRIGGGEGKVAFSPQALRAVHRLSGGIPRLVNLVCDRALLAGYVHNTRTIDAPLVVRAAGEVAGKTPRRVALPSYALLGAGVLLVLLGAALWLPGSAQAPAAPPTTAARPLPPPTPATATAPAPAGRLDAALVALPRDASLSGATAAVRALWGEGDVQQTAFRTHLDQVRRLDLPVVLEMFHPARRDTCFVALLRLTRDDATISTGGGDASRVSVAELDRLWTRQAVFLWRDFASQAAAPEAERTSWARDSLSRLGFVSDAAPASGVVRFQQSWDLVPDGLVGSRTLLTLYAALPYERPHLAGTP